MARQAVAQAETPEEDRQRDTALRPRWLREVIGQRAVAAGLTARHVPMRLPQSLHIGPTPRGGVPSSPMRRPFKLHEHVGFYPVEELAQIVRVISRKPHAEISDDAALELARRSRGT